MKRGGFTLAETILAAFIVSLVMMTLFNIFPSAALAVKRAENQLRADSLAQSALEEYRAMPFSALDDTAGPVELPEVAAGGVRYRTTVLVLPGAGVSGSDLLKRVGVTVAWEYKSRSYSTFHEAWVCDVENY